jgi:hypothetical protein
MTNIVTDKSSQITWYARRNNDQSILFRFLYNGNPFDISDIVFALSISTPSGVQMIALMQGNGLTNGGANGELLVEFTKEQLGISPEKYFIRLLYTIAGKVNLLLNGNFILNDALWSGQVTSSQSININLGNTVVNLSATLIAGEPKTVYEVDSIDTLVPDFAAYDFFDIKAQAENLTIENPAGQIENFESRKFRISDSGVSREIQYGDKFRGLGSQLPSSTIAGKTIYLECFYNESRDTFDTTIIEEF